MVLACGSSSTPPQPPPPPAAPDASVPDAPTDAPVDAGVTAEHSIDASIATPPPPKPPARVDIANLGAPGEAVALVPVRGKITIFDFWATWCKPCKELEPALVAIARAHPGRVAIRRIDVVDTDSAAAMTYLAPKGYGLPHVRVLDPSGKVLLERSSDGKLDVLIAAVRAAVR